MQVVDLDLSQLESGISEQRGELGEEAALCLFCVQLPGLPDCTGAAQEAGLAGGRRK